MLYTINYQKEVICTMISSAITFSLYGLISISGVRNFVHISEALAMGPFDASHTGRVGGRCVYCLCVFQMKLTEGGLVSLVIAALMILSCPLLLFSPILNIFTILLAVLFISVIVGSTTFQSTCSSLERWTWAASMYWAGEQ